MVASVFGGEDAAEVLLAAGADPLATDGTYGETPMLLSALSGNIRIADRLLDLGVDVNHKSGHRDASPLHYAAGYGHPEMVQYLLSRGADQDAIDWHGRTPREFALTCNTVDLPSLKPVYFRH